MEQGREFTAREKTQGEIVLVVLGLVVSLIVWLVWGFSPAVWTFVGFGVLTAVVMRTVGQTSKVE